MTLSPFSADLVIPCLVTLIRDAVWLWTALWSRPCRVAVANSQVCSVRGTWGRLRWAFVVTKPGASFSGHGVQLATSTRAGSCCGSHY